MQDRQMVACEEEHEIIYVLRKFGKRQTRENIARLQEFCRAHKADPTFAPHNRESFYRYLNGTGLPYVLKTPMQPWIRRCCLTY